MNLLKYYVRRALNLSVAHYHPLAAVPASSHLPILIGLARVFQLRQVLEFGSGHFSTLCFLNRDLFPDLQRVQSFETDPEWKQRVEVQANGDPGKWRPTAYDHSYRSRCSARGGRLRSQRIRLGVHRPRTR